jgi:bifunctional UDP-N-acetylglucosamine pyrophosphorylase / glucosamine-1-phosphate N-acetyltransferase
MKTTAVILAAGQGTRMRSKLPKVLHTLLGRPMICYAMDAARQVSETPPVLVVGHAADQVRQVAGDAVRYVVQEPQSGTGHAVQQTRSLLKGNTDLVLVTTADMPLLSAGTLQRLVSAQVAHAGPLTLLTVLSDEPRGFGRVLRDDQGRVREIVEEAQATPEQLAIQELNTSVYCFSAGWLWEALDRIPLSPKGEYYLTDLVGIAVTEGLSVQSITLDSSEEAIGINDRTHLAEVEAILRKRINLHWMLSGVTLIDPATIYIEADVKLGQDTIIWPNTYLQGETIVGAGCVIGPDTILRAARVGDGCKVQYSVLEGALLEENVEIGPFGHLRKGAHLAQGVHMGNFGEVKNAYLGPGTRMGHFSYIGDATIGEDVNIGAGTITCNYDGEQKHHTDIGERVFIGSDTMLVAPIKIGDDARTGAGAVVTKDIPANTLAVGVPARAIRKLKKSD